MPAPLPIVYRSQHIVINIKYLKQALTEKSYGHLQHETVSARGFIKAFNPTLDSMPCNQCEEYADNRQFGKRRRGRLP
jgi:hypothetical protein